MIDGVLHVGSQTYSWLPVPELATEAVVYGLFPTYIASMDFTLSLRRP